MSGFKIRRSSERGSTAIGWLTSRHSFSFGEYHDPVHMGFRTLRVINDDIVEAGQGFGTHGHRDMEIISVVLKGALEHRDSLGHGDVLHPGDVQVMSAGSGIRHSEFNPSSSEASHFLQIWIQPEKVGIQPRYAQKHFPSLQSSSHLTRVAGKTPEEDDGALMISQDAHVFVGALTRGETRSYEVAPGRGIWLQMIAGSLHVSGHSLLPGDGVSCETPGTLTLVGEHPDTRFMLFDLT
jgi:redox-sensitive bicupin YhaK (pirin superfamily)